MATKKNQQEVIELAPESYKRPWYDYLTPALGFKWGASVTMIAYIGLYEQVNLGLTIAAWILAAFIMLEWAEMAWKEFKRRG